MSKLLESTVRVTAVVTLISLIGGSFATIWVAETISVERWERLYK